MSGTIAGLGIAVDSGDAVQAATDLDKLTAAGVKAEKAADDVTAGFKKTADAADKLAEAEARAAQATDEAKARLIEVAKASLQNSEYYQRLTTSVTSTAGAMDASGTSAASLAALQRRLQADSDALVGVNQQSAQAAKQAAAATGVQADGLQALLAKINPTIAAFERLDQQQELLNKHFKAGNIDSDQFKAYSADIDRTRAKLGDFDEGLKKTGVSSAQTQAALRQLPAQFTDIFTSLAGGQNPLMVLIQQGGQIKDSFGGIGNTFDALKGKISSLFTGGAQAAVLSEALAGVAIGAEAAGDAATTAQVGLDGMAEGANTAADAAKNAKEAASALGLTGVPVSGGLGLIIGASVAVAAAMGLLIYGYSQGSKEADEYNKAIILTGNYAGTSAGQLANLAQQVSATNGTVGQAAETLAKLAGSGTIAGESFQDIAEAASLMEDATGKSIDATIAEFAKIAKDPVAAAKELNDQYHFLTASVYSQIVALKEQGDTIGAAKLLTDTYADTVKSRAGEITNNLGLIESGWKAIKDAAAGALDATLNVGRQETLEQQIVALQKRINTPSSYDAIPIVGEDNPDMTKTGTTQEQDQKQLGFLQQQLETQKAIATAQGLYQETQNKGVAALSSLHASYLSGLDKEAKKKLEIQQLDQKRADALKAEGVDVEQVNREYAVSLKAINERNKDTKGPANQLNLTAFNDAQNNLKSITGYYQNLEKELDSAQKAGLVSAESYSSQRVAIVEQERGDVTAAYEAEIAALEAVRGKSSTTGQQRIQLDQKIADARTSMVKAQKDADSQLEVLATNEQGRIKQATAASEAYVAQLERQRAALGLQGDRAAASIGLSDRQQGLQSSLDSTTDKFNDERAKLLDRRKTAPDKYSQEDYEKDLASVTAAEGKYRDTVLANYDKMTTAQSDWESGAASAFHNYLESAQNVAGQMKSAFTSLFDGLTDATVGWAFGADESFGDVAISFLKMLAKMEVQAAASSVFSSVGSSGIGSLVSGLLGGTSAAGSTAADYTGSAFSSYVSGARATGGAVASNSLYQVNELGPELYSQGGKSYLMTGADGGSVTPLSTGAGSSLSGSSSTGDVRVSISIASDGSTDVSTNQSGLQQFGSEVGKFVEQKYKELEARSLGAQGNIRKAINGRA
ncbi:phage tail length tape measure family protein [Pseudomonas bohemica]|uniref:phage tail length tape measure family protein n=1 Tax=Pseudomonas bohemica TaxID=2044872 RepID=UPI000DA5FDF4|nr:phage tail length tape measure family protein [Pseudomonas bohemica]